MADEVKRYRPASKTLPQGVYKRNVPEALVTLVISVDGVPEFLMMVAPGDEDAIRDFMKLKGSYSEMVGEDQGHYIAATAHACEQQPDGLVQVGNGVLLWEDGVRTLTRVEKTDEVKARAKKRNGATPKTASKSRTRKAAKTTAKRGTTAKKTTTTRATAPKRVAKKRTTTAKKTATRRATGRKTAKRTTTRRSR